MPGQSASEAMKGPPGPAAPGLKDPLQGDQTAYEILGLTRSAVDGDVQLAFGKAIGKKVSVQKVTAAKKILQSPAERALLDVFHYLPEWADRLVPNPIQQPSVLDLPRRGSTAQAWENALKTGFPDTGVAHSLAVLWYWWALKEEETAAFEEARNGRSTADQMWQKAIACWAMVLSSEDFWPGSRISHEVAGQVSASLVDRLTSRLHEIGQKHGGNGSPALALRYRELELAFTTELRTAKQIGGAGVRTKRGKVVCGLLMLQQIDLLGTVKQQVEAGLAKNPSSEHLKKVREALSPYSHISALIDGNKPQAALDALDKLAPASEWVSPSLRVESSPQQDAELQVLRIRALHALGKQQASLNHVADALDSWERALTFQPDSVMKARIAGDIVASSQARSAALKQHQPELAIALLERALKLTDDTKLQLLIAELLTDRAVRTIMEAQKTAAQQGSQNLAKAKEELKKGLDDLERAAKLGWKRAADQLDTARDIYEEIASGSLLREAHAAAEKEDWDTAIRCLRTALTSATSASAPTLRQNLAVCLVNRAMGKANRALEQPNPAVTARDQMFTRLSLDSTFGVGCALCHSTYGSSWYSVNLPGGSTARLCADCAAKLQTAIADAAKPNPASLTLLRAAEKELSEAVELDPSNDHARTNLAELRGIISQLAGGAVFAPAPRAPAAQKRPAASQPHSGSRTSRAPQKASSIYSSVSGFVLSWPWVVVASIGLALPGRRPLGILMWGLWVLFWIIGRFKK